jgi:hypothetical protein
MENKMIFVNLTNEQIRAMDDEVLVLAEASIARLPSYDTDEGRAARLRYQAEITRRNLNVSETLQKAVLRTESTIS